MIKINQIVTVTPSQEFIKQIKRILHLHVKHIYFVQMRDGLKNVELRKITPYWEKKLAEAYDEVWVYDGYPKRGDESKVLKYNYEGYVPLNVTHPHFGGVPTDVYGILVRDKAGTPLRGFKMWDLSTLKQGN